jgi:hypothetical protein
MFWSFLTATLSPLIIDLVVIFINSIIKKRA